MSILQFCTQIIPVWDFYLVLLVFRKIFTMESAESSGDKKVKSKRDSSHRDNPDAIR